VATTNGAVSAASLSSDDQERSITSQPSHPPPRPLATSESGSDDEDPEDDPDYDEGMDYPDEEDLMELEEEDEDDEEEEEKDDLAEEEDDGLEGEEEEEEDEEEGNEEVAESQSELAQQLHSALQELSQTHSNVRYINHVYASPAATAPETRSRSISSSLSSLVSGIRRVTARNPRRVNSSFVSSSTSSGHLPTRSHQLAAAAAHRRIFSLDSPESKYEEDELSSSPILWRTSLRGNHRVADSTSPVPISLRSLLFEGLVSSLLSSPPRLTH
jgi:cobalamin biosynthesis protein CobT